MALPDQSDFLEIFFVKLRVPLRSQPLYREVERARVDGMPGWATKSTRKNLTRQTKILTKMLTGLCRLGRLGIWSVRIWTKSS